MLIACGLTNAFLVDSNLTDFLKYQHVILGTLLVLAMAHGFFQDAWPTRMATLFPHIKDRKRMLHEIRQARALLARYALVQSEFVDLARVDAHIRTLQVYLQHAEEDSSVFVSTLREVLEDLVNLRVASGDSYHKQLPETGHKHSWQLTQTMGSFRAR